MTEDWKVGFQKALGDYFYAQDFFVYDPNMYGDGRDFELTPKLKAHLGKSGWWVGASNPLGECSVNREQSDQTIDFKEETGSFFAGTDVSNYNKTFVTANLTCNCGAYIGVRVALEDSLSNAIKWVTK